MAFQVIIKSRFANRFKKVSKYLKMEFGSKAANDFYKLVIDKIDLLANRPNIGSQTAIAGVKSVLVGRGRQNKLYYKLSKNNLVILDMKDTRLNPKRNRFYKK